jgi:protein-S-isoprenylcysteine O-methyltransferase Ste14
MERAAKPPRASSLPRESTGTLVLRTLSRTLLLAPLFLAAGRIDWGRGWVYAGLIVGGIALNFAVMRWKNPSLIRARLEKHDNVEPFDKTFFRISVPLALLFFVVAGLDERYGWTTLEPRWLVVGILLHAAGMAPILWAAMTNPFMEVAVRIQEDRGQFAVRTGPYRFVRHPMYVGLLIMFAGWPLVVDSLWAYVPLAALAIAYIVRTALEDRTLRRELAGYEDYTKATRYRLLPGVW